MSGANVSPTGRNNQVMASIGTRKLILLALMIGFILQNSGYGAAGDATAAANAAQKRDMTTLRTLLQQHIDVNAAQPDGTTALHWAAHWNDLEAVNLLLRSGADSKAVNRYGATPLSEAVV